MKNKKIEILPLIYCPKTSKSDNKYAFVSKSIGKTDERSDGYKYKINLLEKNLSNNKTTIDEFNNRLKENENIGLSLIVAPEYYFNRFEFPYSVSEFKSIIRALIKISSKYKTTLIIPGTIPWYTQNDITKKIKLYVCLPAFYKGEFIFATSKLANKSDHNLSPGKHSLNNITNPFWFLHSNWGFYVTQDKKRITMHYDTIATRQDRLKILKNFNDNIFRTMCVKEKWNPTLDVPFLVRINDAISLKVGAEVCADHLESRLSSAVDSFDLDLHVVVSHGATVVKTGLATRNKGYLIHVDGSTRGHGVYKCINTLHNRKKFVDKFVMLKLEEDKGSIDSVEAANLRKKIDNSIVLIPVKEVVNNLPEIINKDDAELEISRRDKLHIFHAFFIDKSTKNSSTLWKKLRFWKVN